MIAYAGGRTENVGVVVEEVVRATYRDMLTEADWGAATLVDAIQKKLTGPSSGELEQTAGIVYRESAPGEPPAYATGVLHDSVKATAARRVGSAVEASYGPSADFASVLEFGGRNDTGGRVLPRPFVRPAEQETIPKLDARWRRRLG